MVHNWVGFCEEEIPVKWDPNAVGTRIARRPRRNKSQSVPLIQGLYHGNHLKQSAKSRSRKRWRSQSAGSHAGWRQGNSLKKGKDSRKNGRKPKSRSHHNNDDCEETPYKMAVPDQNQAHILDHIRCNCPACMDFTCKWRKAILRDFRDTLVRARSLSPCGRRKPQRRAPRVGSEGPREVMSDGGRHNSQTLNTGRSRSQRPSSLSTRCVGRNPSQRRHVWFGEDCHEGDNAKTNHRGPGEPYNNSGHHHHRLDVFHGDPRLLNQKHRSCSTMYPEMSAKDRDCIKNKEKGDGFDIVAMDGTMNKSVLKTREKYEYKEEERRSRRRNGCNELIASDLKEDTIFLCKDPEDDGARVSYSNREHVIDKTRKSHNDDGRRRERDEHLDVAMDGPVSKSILKTKTKYGDKEGEIRRRKGRDELIESDLKEDTIFLWKDPEAARTRVPYLNREHEFNDKQYKHRSKLIANENKRHQDGKYERYEDLNVPHKDHCCQQPHDSYEYSSRRHSDGVHSNRRHSSDVMHSNQLQYRSDNTPSGKRQRGFTLNTARRRQQPERTPHRCSSPGCGFSDYSSNAADTHPVPVNDPNTSRTSPPPPPPGVDVAHFPACRPFCPTDKILALPKTRDEKEWLARHLDLMTECGLECHATARERTKRMFEKVDGLKRSIDRTCLDFGDVKTRLKQIGKLQKNYLKTSADVLDAIRNNNNAAKQTQWNEFDCDPRLVSPRRYNDDYDDDKYKYTFGATPDQNTHRSKQRLSRAENVDDLKDRCNAILSSSLSSVSNDSQEGSAHARGRERGACNGRYLDKLYADFDDKGNDEIRNDRERFASSSHTHGPLDKHQNPSREWEEIRHRNRYFSDDNENKRDFKSRHGKETKDSDHDRSASRRLDTDNKTGGDRHSSYFDRHRLHGCDDSRQVLNPLVMKNGKDTSLFVDKGMRDDDRKDCEKDGKITSLHRLHSPGKMRGLRNNTNDGFQRNIRNDSSSDFNKTDDDSRKETSCRQNKEEDDGDESINRTSYHPVFRTHFAGPSFRRCKTMRDQQWRRHHGSKFTGYDSDEEDSGSWTASRHCLRRRRRKRICDRSCSRLCRNRNCNQNDTSSSYCLEDSFTDDTLDCTDYYDRAGGTHKQHSVCRSPCRHRFGQGRQEQLGDCGMFSSRSECFGIDNVLENSTESDLQSSGYFSD